MIASPELSISLVPWYSIISKWVKKLSITSSFIDVILLSINIPITVDMSLNIGKLPAISYMEGADLVTEGILTLTKTMDDLEKGKFENDAAGKLIEFMLNSDCIHFMVGAKINQAHYDPNMPIEIEVRKNIVKKLEKILTLKYMKKVVVKYM